MNYFLNNDPGKLYTASEQILEQMKADGAGSHHDVHSLGRGI